MIKLFFSTVCVPFAILGSCIQKVVLVPLSTGLRQIRSPGMLQWCWSTGETGTHQRPCNRAVPAVGQQGLGGHRWAATPTNHWRVTNPPSEADKLLGLAFYSRRKDQISDWGAEFLLVDESRICYANLFSTEQQNRREPGTVNRILFVSIYLALQEFFHSILFLSNSLYLSTDLALLCHSGLGEHCRELGFGGDVLPRLRPGVLQGLKVP